ncbi:glycosyltransferase family 25 protein [Helicobacter pylori]|uniref:glycosyltransferase family 25 protein n=1 Tax=Helicobacter pylori TaxID=210 RepID=UPI001932B478|nr:glycosyltransferase family 25 protein [Helicobacter pylori]MBM0604683.1 glycosyltransferase family 25 protein [Helicobacter pylori]MBM0615126.1 glycosyltransferase family 25 protein [Helicobacter pylori]MBM0616557.1 glycosyltransferase family 25 protein [Helicobacter pylori]MBM0617557.1 glycosyltransferase family 25 protein [Helicobacter pylori]MBM0629867.1 glycosyltransferase family 25 protein [Helicobacter pylori]
MAQVYIISLKESQRRLDTEKLVLESNEKFKGRCVFQIFDAISPKHEDFEKFVQELYDYSSLLKSDWFHSDYCYQELLPQEFGCYLSHYFLWKECVKTNQPVVILEDDVVLESHFMQALEDCLKSPFDFVRLYGHYWGGHKTNLCALPIYTEAEEAEASIEETPIENHEVTPPPNPTQDAQQDSIIETQQELPEPCKIAPQKISFNQVVFKKIKRKLNHFIGNILARTEVYKKLTGKYDNLTTKYDDLTTKYDDLTKKYESLLAKEANIKETFWERRADNEKEALFLEHFYLTSVYVATTAGYYLTPKGAKTFIEATERFKIIEPVDMFMNNPTYHDVANLTYLPCPISLNKHAFNSTIQNAKKPDISLKPPRKSYFDNLFYHKFNAQKCLKAFHKYSKQYAPLKTPKEV